MWWLAWPPHLCSSHGYEACAHVWPQVHAHLMIFELKNSEAVAVLMRCKTRLGQSSGLGPEPTAVQNAEVAQLETEVRTARWLFVLFY